MLASTSSATSSAPAAEHSCSKAISIYAMQKTGSTFLGRFSREVTLHRKMCRAYQMTKEYICQTTMYIDCPRNSMHRKTVSLKQTFTTQLPETIRGLRCNSELRHTMFGLANDWLRSTDVTVPFRYNKSVTWLMSRDGFVRGPLRQLYIEHADDAVPSFPGYHNVIIVHTRHPVEMMVSAFHCIANPKVCPVRSKFLGSHVPVNDTISSVDEFVLSGLQRPGSTPYAIMQRNQAITRFMTGFSRSAVGKAGRVRNCQEASLYHSKYELMVTNFSEWASQILEQMVAGRGQRKTLHRTLVAQYRNDFVPDGKHKHALHTGANIAKLKKDTIQQLMQDAQLKLLLKELGYDWLGHDRGLV